MRERNRWISLSAAILWCLLIFGTSSTVILPERFFRWFGENVFKGPESLGRFKVFWGFSWIFIVKGWHAAEFLILFTLIRALLDRFSGARRARNTMLAVVFCVLFAMSDEYHQTFVIGRGGNWKDVAIDSAGVFGGWLIGLFLGTRRTSSTDVALLENRDRN